MKMIVATCVQILMGGKTGKLNSQRTDVLYELTVLFLRGCHFRQVLLWPHNDMKTVRQEK